MLNEQKYKRWAWGALIGLAIIIVIAGIIMAMSAKTPKPATEVATSKASTTVVSGEKNEKVAKDPEENGSASKNNQKTETKSETTTNSSESTSSQNQSNSGSVSNQTQTTTTDNTSSTTIPKTGPEDAVIPIVGLAIVAYLFAYNVALFKKNA